MGTTSSAILRYIADEAEDFALSPKDHVSGIGLFNVPNSYSLALLRKLCDSDKCDNEDCSKLVDVG